VKVFAALSRDNKSIAWHDGRTVHTAELQTGTTRRLCIDCAAQPSDWTASGDILVTLPASDAIGGMSPRDGAIRVILRPVATTLGGVAISPDDKWIAFESLESTNAASPEGRIMVARASVTPIAKDSWIEVSMLALCPDGHRTVAACTSFLAVTDGVVFGRRASIHSQEAPLRAFAVHARPRAESSVVGFLCCFFEALIRRFAPTSGQRLDERG
jgi:hypothetical protein